MNNITAIRSLTLPPLRRWINLSLVCTAVALSGCASLSPSTPQEIVQKRATDYWQARTTGQLDKAYALSTPSYRKLRNEAQFRSQFGGGASIETAEVSKVECEPEKCSVQMKLGVKPAIIGMNFGIVPIYIDEVWVLEDGRWWHYQDV